MDLKYSIILPVKNGGDHLKECIKSILAQTYIDFSCLVLENGSTDGSCEWLQSQKDERIKIYASPAPLTIEQNWARIKNIEKNEFITLIGHDDILLPDYLEEMNKLIERHPQASLYQTHFSFIDVTGNIISHCKPMEEMQYASEFIGSQFTRTIDSTGTGYMMRSKDYDELGGISPDYPNLIYADYQLWVQLTSLNYKATSKKNCFKYRVHDSASKLTNGEQYLFAFEKYVYFISSMCGKSEQFRLAVEKHGHEMLMRTCEELSHRLLKTSFSLREMKVKELVLKFNDYAEAWIPGQPFEPFSKRRIKLAAILDQNAMGRRLFNLYKKFKI